VVVIFSDRGASGDLLVIGKGLAGRVESLVNRLNLAAVGPSG
jgi:hypothetical protein